MKKSKLLIIIPAYNEEKSIKQVVTQCKRISSHVLVINDASTDKTEIILKKNKVNHINLINKLQYGAVIQTGFKYALYNKYDYVALIDGDGQHDPTYINRMLQLVKKGKVDLVIGSRYKSNYRMPFFRKLGSFIFSLFIRLITREVVHDPTSGYQVFNRKVIEIYADDLYPTDYPDADVIISLILNNCKVQELSMNMKENKEKSMHNFFNSFYYIYKMSISIIITILRSKQKK